MEEETKEFWSYVLSSFLFVVSLITSSLPWSYWAYTINTCPGYNCECILFGNSFSDQFSGGRAIHCQLTTLLQIPLFLTASFLSFYQGRRALSLKRVRKRIRHGKMHRGRCPVVVLTSRSGRILKEGDIILEERNVDMEPPPRGECIALAFVSCFSLFLVSGISVYQVVGYQWSCNEYKKMLVKLIKASGNMAQILSERLECTAIFNFMDYLQPNRKLYDPFDYGRKNKINTGLSLYIAQLSLIANSFLWLYITIFNFRNLKKRNRTNRKLMFSSSE